MFQSKRKGHTTIQINKRQVTYYHLYFEIFLTAYDVSSIKNAFSAECNVCCHDKMHLIITEITTFVELMHPI